MLPEPFPATLDVRKATLRGASVDGALRPADLSRFRGMLAGDEGNITARMAFNKDDEGHTVIDLAVQADVTVICQRCLDVLAVHLNAENRLAVVWSDSQAAALPGHLDPLIVEETSCDLWAIVEEELILALPPFSYHDTEDCRQSIAAYTDPPPEEDAGTEKLNPFGVLAQLKPGEK